MPSTDRFRIALVGPDPAAHGGIAAYLHALLASPLAREYELIPVATHREGSGLAKLAQAVRGVATVRRLCAAGAVDLVHVHSSWGGSLARKAVVVAIARRAGCPVVLQLHGSALEHGIRTRVGRAVAGSAARSADVVLVATDSWAKRVRLLLGAGDVRVVPNAPDVAAIPAGLPAQGRTVLFLGRLERAKGVFELVDAAARLARTEPQLRVVLAGDGGERRALAERVAAAGLTDVVELPGWVDGPRKAELLAAARCVVLPSYDEGLPLALLEGMAAGRPVVASRVGAIPAAAGDAALLVPPRDAPALADALAEVLDDDELAARLGAEGAARARATYSTERVAALLAQVYGDVLSTTVRSHRSTQKARHTGRAGARPARHARTERSSSAASQ